MAIMDTGCRGLLISGGSGAGKTVTGQAIGGILTGQLLPTAVIDLDALAQYGPPANQSGFHDRLKVRNLAAVWATYRAAGARFVVVSGVIETSELRQAYVGCLTGCDVQTVRLERARVEFDGPAGGEDFVVVNDRPLPKVATEILQIAGWIAA
ncbi:hypothetical protein [Streptomyces sp. SID13031]|uniref:hypothetical protein n=1 Tax=Streptomyces sp. SID13031 TaxID=2706046 RepID=UPI0013CA5C2B|nr:hypothetical protein [Streptomyces sp. SID13031]NEA32103.1 hypothetical protein [Streptomyces sp. SID13031]